MHYRGCTFLSFSFGCLLVIMCFSVLLLCLLLFCFLIRAVRCHCVSLATSHADFSRVSRFGLHHQIAYGRGVTEIEAVQAAREGRHIQVTKSRIKVPLIPYSVGSYLS